MAMFFMLGLTSHQNTKNAAEFSRIIHVLAFALTLHPKDTKNAVKFDRVFRVFLLLFAFP